ncbi:MAG: hypothetical protein EOO53_14315 [Gammaproteobacteria bacterium]|nr:MAG: hypothetical protein EOO53_14315 [Gammaproteobacteria bacterium]
MKGPILGYREQILQTLATKPDLGGIIHGQRPVLKGNPYRRVSSFYSVKAGGAFLLEGGIEAAVAPCLESSSLISTWGAQGLTVTLSAKEWVLLDFVGRRVDGSLIAFEAKPSIKGLSPGKSERYNHAKNLLDREGIEFRLIDSYMLPTKLKLDQLRTLYTRGHQQNWGIEVIKLATDILHNANCNLIVEARHVLTKAGIPSNLCDYLVFHKIIAFKDAINDTTEIAA